MKTTTTTPHPWRKSYRSPRAADTSPHLATRRQPFRSPRAASISAPVWQRVPNEVCPICKAGILSNGLTTVCENRGKCDFVFSHVMNGRLE